jgi:hypothetical protein
MPSTKTPRQKRSDIQEVAVTAPRMSSFEKGLYDRAQMTPQQKRDEALDMAVGFSTPIHIPKIDIRKLSSAKRAMSDFLTKASSGVDNVAKAATDDEDNKYAKGGMVKSRDGIAKRGKTKGRMR